MSNVLALVPSTRPKQLWFMLAAWSKCEQTRNIPVVIAAQREPKAQFERVIGSFGGMVRDWTWQEAGGKVWQIRNRMLADHGDADVWINMDDDMEAVPGMTTFNAMIEKVQEPDVGVVSANWARSESLLDQKKRKDEYIGPLPFTNTAGGMMYGREVRELVLRQAERNWLYEDIQFGLTAYLEGLENYRYLGSLLIHRILRPGGQKVAFSEIPHEAPDSRWVVVERSAQDTYHGEAAVNNLKMPNHADTTPAARARHREAKAARKRGESLPLIEW